MCIRDRLYPEYDRSDVYAIGGGAKSDVWMQMNADATGKRYSTLRRKDVSMWGAVILAGNAVGVFPDLKETAEASVTVDKVFEPNAEAGAQYAKHIALYEQYLVELRSFFERIQALSAQ